MTKKRIGILLAAALLVLAGGYWAYWAYHPHIRLLRGTGSSGDSYWETVVVAHAPHRGIPVARSVEEKMWEIGRWSDTVQTDLYNYGHPRHITVSGEVAGGRTTLRYQGTVTTKDGRTVDYRNEQVFDFVLVPENELLK